MRTVSLILFILGLVSHLQLASAVTLKKEFGNQYLGIGETRLYDLSEYFGGFNLKVTMDQAPLYATLQSKLTVVQNNPFQTPIQFTSAQFVLDTTQTNVIAIVALDNKNNWYLGTTNDATKVPILGAPLPVDAEAGANFICYDIVMTNESNIFIDCVTFTTNIDYNNVLYQYTQAGVLVGKDTRKSPILNLPYPKRRHLKAAMNFVLRYAEGKEWPTNMNIDCYVEMFTAGTTAPTLNMTLKGTNFGLTKGLNIADVDTNFGQLVYIADVNQGIFATTPILIQLKPPLYFTFPLLNRQIQDIHAFTDVFEGGLGLFLLISVSDVFTPEASRGSGDVPRTGNMILEFEWADLSKPATFISDYDLGTVDSTIQLSGTSKFIVATTITGQTTQFQIYQRNSRLYTDIFAIQVADNAGLNIFHYLHPSQINLFTLTPSATQVIQVRSNLLLLKNPPSNESYSIRLTVADGTGTLQTIVPLVVLDATNLNLIQPSGVKGAWNNVACINSQFCTLNLTNFFIGPGLRYTFDDPNWVAVKQPFMHVRFRFDGEAVIGPLTGIYWSQWEHDPSDEGIFYYFTQLNNSFHQYSCEITQNAVNVSCFQVMETPVNFIIRSVTVGQSMIAIIIDNPQVITFYNKEDSVGPVFRYTFVGQPGCNDIMFMNLISQELLVCTQKTPGQILFFVLQTFTTPPSLFLIPTPIKATAPDMIYTSDQIPSVVFIRNNNELLIIQLATLTVINKIVSGATSAGTNWHVAVTGTKLVILSADANLLEEWDIYDLLAPFATKYYPTYGLQLSLDGGKNSYDYSHTTQTLFVSMFEPTFRNHHLVAYSVGNSALSVLLRNIDLETRIPGQTFLQSVSLDGNSDYFMLINQEMFFTASLDSVPRLIVQRPDFFNSTDRVGQDKVNVGITNDWNTGNPFQVTFQLSQTRSIDNLTASNLLQSLDLTNMISFDRAAPFPQTQQIPVHSIYNGSLMGITIECEEASECVNQIKFQDHFAITSEALPVNDYNFLDFTYQNGKIYTIGKKTIFALSHSNNSQVLGHLTIPLGQPNVDDHTCYKVHANEVSKYLIAVCTDDKTAQTYLVLILTHSFKPIIQNIVEVVQAPYVSQIRIYETFVFLLINDDEYDHFHESRVLIYRVNLQEQNSANSLLFVTEVDSLIAGTELLKCSYFDVRKNINATLPYQYHLFLLDPFYGIRFIALDLLDTTRPGINVKLFNLTQILANYQVNLATVFAGIHADYVTKPGITTAYTVLVTTANHNHFGLVLDLNTTTLTVGEVFTRYADLSVVSRLKATAEWFVVFAYPADQFGLTQDSAFLLYKRDTTLAPGSVTNVAYKNVHAGEIPMAVRPELARFEFVQTQDPLTQVVTTRLYRAHGLGSDRIISYTIQENATLTFTIGEVDSFWVKMTGSNAFGSASVLLSVNGKSLFRRYLLWEIIGATIILIALFACSGYWCYNQRDDDVVIQLSKSKKGLLDDDPES